VGGTRGPCGRLSGGASGAALTALHLHSSRSRLAERRAALRTRRIAAAFALATLTAAAGCATRRVPARSAPADATTLEGVWELVSVSTRWPDGRVTAPWGATPVGRLTYGADGRMTALLMDERRNQADGRAVAPEVQASAAAYYGTYVVDTARRVVTHHVAASLRASEAGSIARSYVLRGATLLLTAHAMYEGAAVTHTLVWRRAGQSR
jgi:hypothetical protein